MVLQFGTDGTFGEGILERTGPDSYQLTLTFFSVEGSSWKSGHRDTRRRGQRVTESFLIDADGNWKPQRTYTWTRED